MATREWWPSSPASWGTSRGGLHYVLVGAMYPRLRQSRGQRAADMAAVAPVPVSRNEEERGAKARRSRCPTLSDGGRQTETIPPSLVLITIGSVTLQASRSRHCSLGGPPARDRTCDNAVRSSWWRYRGGRHVTREAGGPKEEEKSVVRSLIYRPSRPFALPFVIRAARGQRASRLPQKGGQPSAIVYSVLAEAPDLPAVLMAAPLPDAD